MGVEARLFANFREAAGQGRVLVEARSVEELLDALVERFGDRLAEQLYEPRAKKLRPMVNILVNGRRVDPVMGLGTRLNDGDVVAIFPPVSGGSFVGG